MQRNFIFICTFLMCVSSTVQAEPVAGEITTRETRKTPYVVLEPKQNIADIFHISGTKTDE